MSGGALLEIFDPKAPPKAIGIDLGTTHSLVAYVKSGQPETIADCNGVSVIPSVVHYASTGEVVVGHHAISRASEAPHATIASAKRFMGRGADDPETQRPGPYVFAPPDPSGPNVVKFNVGSKAVTPVEVSAQILKALRRLAEDELRSVGGAVITVPAYFDDAQRQATKDAARLAGLEVLRLLNEPTAAALAYGLQRQTRGTFVVYDLGGGTFDVTLLELDDGVFHVRSTGGDSALGGDDMDRLIAGDMLAELGMAPTSIDPSAWRLLLAAAREVKHRLTDTDIAEYTHPLKPGERHSFSKQRFEELIMPLLERTAKASLRALADAGIDRSKLSGVILVGGATRVPAVRAFTSHLFGREPMCDIDPEKVVALGAALQASALAQEAEAQDVLLLDVIPLSLGIEVGGGVVDRILPRNSTIPAAARATYTTQQDQQTGFEIHVVQGERELAKDCRSLARFLLRGIPPMPAGMARLEVTFRVDADGLLQVHAREERTQIEQSVEVRPSYGLDDDTVEQMLLDAIDHGEDDLAQRKLLEARVEGERVASSTHKALGADADLLDEAERRAIDAALAALESALRADNAAFIEGRMRDLDAITKPFAGRRMNRAIAFAIEGSPLEDVARDVEHAKGIEEAHAR